MNVYLDTSGLNYLADNQPDKLINRLKLSGIKFFISSTTLWEILLNSNIDRREELIYWGQTNCEKKLLKSISEIIIDYYNLDCPEKNRQLYWKDPYTKLEVGKTWTNIHNDITKTIPVELSKLKDFTKTKHDLSKKFKRVIDSMTDPNYSNKKSDWLYLNAQKIAAKLDFPWNDKYQKYYVIAVIVTFFVVCVGIELDKSKIRSFWGELKVDDPLDRLDFLIENKPMFFKRGPIAEMTFMIQTQLAMKNSKSRGLLHDCFHLVYAYFTDFFLTNDRHFREFRDSIKHEAFNRILITDEVDKIVASTKYRLLGRQC